MIGEKTTLKRSLINHPIERMGDLDKAKEYTPKEQPKPAASSHSRKSYSASATGTWVTINGNHVRLKE